MNDDGVKQVVEALEKLGHQSWPAFVKTVYINGVAGAIGAGVVVVALILAQVFVYRRLKKEDELRDGLPILIFIPALAAVALFAFMGFAADAMNPEGEAVVRFLKLLRG